MKLLPSNCAGLQFKFIREKSRYQLQIHVFSAEKTHEQQEKHKAQRQVSFAVFGFSTRGFKLQICVSFPSDSIPQAY